ncbi:myogenesis-regulating glycosidase-like [Cylas formicarius]|uniref:myogenesis-regulating glycosidase-like n=1 Tax=Cylas formicarius TaxID=197179 RepID=UPI002958342D|nr:myogenesis-regulating glycosidase-like [Cylas formicarius]
MRYSGTIISLLLVTFYDVSCILLKDLTGDVTLSAQPTANGINVALIRQERNRLVGTIGSGKNFSGIDCVGESSCKVGESRLDILPVDDGFEIRWEAVDLDEEFRDCFALGSESVSWYGGPEIATQEWPIEKLTLSDDDPYVLRKDDNFAVPERYWLNSNGGYVFVDDRVPLFVDQNNREKDTVCFVAKIAGPYINRLRVLHSYKIVALDNAKVAHVHAVNNYLGKPTGIPNVNMIREPIWTTWAKFKKEINEDMVRSFVQDILDHGFNKGQIEIDEDWETCFGTHVFKPDKFGHIGDLVAEIKKNFRVTVWIIPFVNNCEGIAEEGKEKGYFVRNTTGSYSTIWWESDDALQIDFTNPAAAEWYAEKVRRLRTDPGIDSFKFDAGETDYGPQPSVYENVDQELVPNILSQSYLNTVTQFGDLIELRSAFRTQNLPVFLRMIDKDSVWTIDNGLQSLITTLLQLNLNGYSNILPDMIGGNGYRTQPTLELIVRWTQATVFMPAMQFSFLPWDFQTTEEYNATEIIRTMIDLHAEYTEEIVKALNGSVNEGVPANRPIWWVDPEDRVAQQNFDEYMLGDNILVAPIVTEGALSREVYLPKGTWKDGNDASVVYEGPKSIVYDAPIEILPYFIKQ